MSDMQEMPETEITLGTGRLLGLFFGLAVVCAVFFGLGFALGRNTSSSASLVQAAATPAAESSTVQPAAARTAPETPACADAAGCDAPKDSGSHELAFLKTTEPKDAATTPPTTTVAEERAAAPPAPRSVAPARPARESKLPASVQSGFVAQVAAVRRREDAETLVSSLRRKNYPVFIAAESPDRLFHVQVGPFSDRKDAQAMKDKLSGDGYNSLVK